MRTMLPAGSRKAQSRIPYGWSVGSWTTSASVACRRSKVPSRSAVARVRDAKGPLAIISAIVWGSSWVSPGGACGGVEGGGGGGGAGRGARRIEDDRGAGRAGRADRDPVHPAVLDVVADFPAERVAVEGEGRVGVVVRQEGLVDREVHAGHASGAPRGSLLDS